MLKLKHYSILILILQSRIKRENSLAYRIARKSAPTVHSKYREVIFSWGDRRTSIHCDARHFKRFQSQRFCIYFKTFFETWKHERMWSHAKAPMVVNVRPLRRFTILPLIEWSWCWPMTTDKFMIDAKMGSLCHVSTPQNTI